MKAELLYIYLCKGLVNRIRLHPWKSLAVAVAFCAASFGPILAGGISYSYSPDARYVLWLATAWFALLGALILFKYSSFADADEQFLSLLQLLPAKTAQLFQLRTLGNITDRLLRFSSLYLILFIMFLRSGGWTALPFGLLVFVLTVAQLQLSLECMNLLSVMRQRKYGYYALAALALVVALTFLWPVAALPNVLIAKLFVMQFSAGFCRQPEFWAAFAGLAGWTALFYAAYLRLLALSGLQPWHVFAKQTAETDERGAVVFAAANRWLRLLPQNIRLFCAKELAQIWAEKAQLLVMAMVIGCGGVAMLFTAVNDAKQMIDRFGLVMVMSWAGYYSGVYSIQREVRTLWLLRAFYPQWGTIAAGKFCGCLICSWLTALLAALVYIPAVMLIIGHGITHFSDAVFWALLVAVPAALASGLAISTIVPYSMVEKKKRITYKLGPLDGVYLMLVMFLVAIPASIAGNALLTVAIPRWVQALFIVYASGLVCAALLLMRRKLRAIQTT